MYCSASVALCASELPSSLPDSSYPSGFTFSRRHLSTLEVGELTLSQLPEHICIRAHYTADDPTEHLYSPLDSEFLWAGI